MTFWSKNSIDFLCGFPKAKKKSSNCDTFMKSTLHYFSHLCATFAYLFTHIKTPQS